MTVTGNEALVSFAPLDLIKIACGLLFYLLLVNLSGSLMTNPDRMQAGDDTVGHKHSIKLL